MDKYLLALCLIAPPATAGVAEVVGVKASKSGDTLRFAVTVRHADTGWQHYADGWGVFALEGAELGYRTLVHPHVDEQPFTRSLSGVTIAPDTAEVIVRPHGNVHGWGEDFILELGDTSR